MTRATSYQLRMLLAPGLLIGARAAPGLLCAAAVLIPAEPTAQQSGVFVVVGDAGAAVSANGDGWEQGDLAAGPYRAVAWNGHVFAAVGHGGYVATSEDGRHWTQRTIDPPDNYFAITAGGSTFVAVGYKVASTSQDGITWTRASHPALGSNWGVAWNGSQFAAVVDDYRTSQTCYVATSPDGSSWTQAWTTRNSADCLWGIAWNGSTFAAQSQYGIFTSASGASWAKQSTLRAEQGSSIGASTGAFVIVSEGYRTIITSTNPSCTSWDQKSLDGVAYRMVGWNGALFAAVGNGYAATSPDGLVWTPRNPPQGSYHAIASNGPRTTDLLLGSLAPAGGDTTGGTAVTLEGANFTSDMQVTFGGTLASNVGFVNSKTLTAFTPPHAPGTVDVVVTGRGGASAVLARSYTYSTPGATLSPPSGPTTGGNDVTVTSSGIQCGATVTFGGSRANVKSCINNGALLVVAPPHAAGRVEVEVTNPDNVTAAFAGYSYYVPGPSVKIMEPIEGPTSGGTSVTITGDYFQNGLVVGFGDLPAKSVTVLPADSITTVIAVAPAHAPGTVKVSVTNPDNQTTTAGEFTYVAPPSVVNVDPSIGTIGGGTSITISGSDFQTGANVTFGDKPATDVTVIGGTSITATTPAHENGVVDVVVTNPDGQAAKRQAFTYTDLPAPVITSATPKAGVTTGGMKVTLDGTGFVAGAEVAFGGVLAKEVTVVDSTKINAFAPAHAEAEVDIVVRNPDGQTGTLSHGFIYMKASGCGQTEAGSRLGLLSFAAGAWALRRRKRCRRG